MSADYTNAAQQRLLKVILFLAGHEVDGLPPGQIASALKTSAANVTRDLANLKEGGFAEQLEATGRWRLGPRLPQIGVALLKQLKDARERVEEVTQRYTRDHR